jgi:hypothetical protein
LGAKAEFHTRQGEENVLLRSASSIADAAFRRASKSIKGINFRYSTDSMLERYPLLLGNGRADQAGCLQKTSVQPIDHFASPAASDNFFERRRYRDLGFEKFSNLPSDPSRRPLVTFMGERKLQIP